MPDGTYHEETSRRGGEGNREGIRLASIPMSRRTVALIAAVVLAAVATVALVSFVQGERDKARGSGEAVEVFVAKDTIPAGKSADAAISEGLIDKTTIPTSALVVGAVGQLSEISGKVAAATVFPNEQIVAGQFVTPAQVRRSGLEIPNNQEAISLEVGIVPGVSDFINPGDRISILAQMTVQRGGQSEARLTYLLQNVEVLQVGTRAFTEEGEETVARSAKSVIMTVALRARDAEKLAFAIFNGQLYLTLLPEGASPTSTPGRTLQNAFN